MTWRSRRQTKKHKKKNRPRKIAELIFSALGALALVFVVFSLLSLTKQSTLVLPVASVRDVLSAKNILTNNSETDEIERLLREKNISFLFVTTASDSAYIVTLPENAEVLMRKENIHSQIASLQLITKRLTMEGKRFVRLDLRFDRPVIVLK